MIKENKPSKESVRELYFKIPVEAYKYIAVDLGYKHPNSVSNKLTGVEIMTMNFFNRILDSYLKFMKEEKFSFKNLNGQFCFYQSKMYYQELVALINSREYILLQPYKRSQILEEQKNIYKQLNPTK